MSKGQRRSNREPKKPKQAKPEQNQAASPGLPPRSARDGAAPAAGDRTGLGNGKR